MAPSLRSSAPNTPTGKSSTTSDSPTVTPRKVHQCSKCKRPRQGHPRSGCPYVDSPSAAPAAENNIVDALGSMNITSPSLERDEDTKATIRSRRRASNQPQLAADETLLSLSSQSQEIVERLMQPGMFDDDTDEDAENAKRKTQTKIVRWQETVHVRTPVESKLRAKMPGTLRTPSPDSSRDSLKTLPDKQETPALEVPALVTSSSDASQTLSPYISGPRPVARTMSMEQRDAFVSNLTSSSDATIYVLPSSDIHSIQASAIKLGLHARIVLSVDKNDPQGLLVLGQDEKAVQKLYKKVETESKKPASRVRAVAGGAVVGVVGAWAGLAFA